MAHQRWNHDSVLAALRTFVRTHGRYPLYHEYLDHRDGLPSRATVQNYCKGFVAELRAEGITAAAPVKTAQVGHVWRRRA